MIDKEQFELSENQMAQVSGGAFEPGTACPFCGSALQWTGRRKYNSPKGYNLISECPQCVTTNPDGTTSPRTFYYPG